MVFRYSSYGSHCCPAEIFTSKIEVSILYHLKPYLDPAWSTWVKVNTRLNPKPKAPKNRATRKQTPSSHLFRIKVMVPFGIPEAVDDKATRMGHTFINSPHGLGACEQTTFLQTSSFASHIVGKEIGSSVWIPSRSKLTLQRCNSNGIHIQLRRVHVRPPCFVSEQAF